MVVALVQDLIFGTRIRSTAQALGTEARLARTPDAFSRLLTENPPQLVLIDLDLTDGDAVSAVAIAANGLPRPRIVAFVSHVHAELARRAEEAGADEVMPRSQFHQMLPTLLREIVPSLKGVSSAEKTAKRPLRDPAT